MAVAGTTAPQDAPRSRWAWQPLALTALRALLAPTMVVLALAAPPAAAC
jgi:hypothetical protein